jgi:ABC transport protein
VVKVKKTIVVDNVSMRFNLASERVDSLKDLLIKKIKFQSCSFDEFWALNNISFSVDKGESCALIGANGSGKSTMLKIISGILTPTKGSVEVNGSIAPLIELGAGFDYELTGRENIFLNGAILGYSKKLMLEKYDEIIDFSELRNFIDVPVKNYSSGMIARLGFSIATMVKPEILVVDEILAVGDQAFQDKCHKRLEDMMNSGTTVLLVSHSAADIKRICQKAVWIDKSNLRFVGNVDEALQFYNKPG